MTEEPSHFDDMQEKSVNIFVKEKQWLFRYRNLILESYTSFHLPFILTSFSMIWAAAWQNQQNNMCVQQWLRSACASSQFDQFLLSA